MHYLRIENVHSGMKLARPIMGDDGKKLVGEGVSISEKILERMKEMGFQGAYIDAEGFEDIVIEDVIPDALRAKAFETLYTGDINGTVSVGKQMVQELKFKDILKLDLLDIKNDNNYVFKHCVSVAVYSIVLGIGCDLNISQLENLAAAGLLHDIGKLDLRKRVLNARHIYNEKEKDEMKKHPLLAYETLKDFAVVSSVTRNSILFHHENLDGSGYYNLEGDKIGLFPRILRIADTYDALTAHREYREAESPSSAIEYIMANAGKLFDREIVNMFIKCFPFYPVGITLQLSNGEMAVVMDNRQNPMRPMLRTMDGRTVDLAEDAGYRSVTIEKMM